MGIVTLIAIVSQVSAYELHPDTYLNEFSNANESCNYGDAFFYTTSSNVLSFNVVYNCCTNGESCILLPFDILNKKVYESNDESEIFHAFYARDAIKAGNIKPDNYYPQSVDICNYFGEKFDEQATSLGFEAGETFAPEKYKQTFKIIKNAGQATGLISEFDIGIFVLSVTCNKMSKVEKEAFLKVGECYQNIKALESGTSYYGQTSQIISCNEESKVMLKAILDSWSQQLKNVANTLVALGKALFVDPIKSAMNNQMPTFKVSPTSYEVVQQVYNKISSETQFFKNPEATGLSDKATSRFNQKYGESTSVYYPLLEKYNLIKQNISGQFSEGFSNFFMNPNVDQTKEREIFYSIKDNLNLMANLIKDGRYNSAINLGNNISLQFGDLNKVMLSNPFPEQKLDYFRILLILLIIAAIIYFIVKNI
jgi:hypothetical protein